MAPEPHHHHKDDYHHHDYVQETLNSVNKRLAKPAFLQTLSASRLPSQAASEASPSPEERLVHAGKGPLDASGSHVTGGRSDEVEGPPATLTQAEETDPIKQLGIDILNAWLACSALIMANRNPQTFAHTHQDLVLAVDVNFYGNRMVTASSDHRLKVWDRKEEHWILLDSWRAHDAEIVDVKWNGPFTGPLLGSIAEDGLFVLWHEDPIEPPHSSRRFKRVSTLRSETSVPFMSLDFKNILTETYLALITRDGYLAVYEPVDPDTLTEWRPLLRRFVGATPARMEEASFRVAWHREKMPAWTAVQAGLDRNALGLAVAAMETVRILRTDKERRFYEAATLTGARGIVRDVAWANGSVRGYDVVATASKDGVVRVYEVSTPMAAAGGAAATGGGLLAPPAAGEGTGGLGSGNGGLVRNAPSGIGAGLASRKTEGGVGEEMNPGAVKHVVKCVAELTQHHGAVWRVSFSPLGDMLISTGDDGTVRTWRRAINGQWMESSDLDVVKQQETKMDKARLVE